MFVIPFMTRLGITNSWGGWSIRGGGYNESGYLELRRCGWSAYYVFWVVLFGSCMALVYCDLEIFCDERTGKPSLDLSKIFGIHLFLAGLVSRPPTRLDPFQEPRNRNPMIFIYVNLAAEF
ncbi:putative photosystem antenna protein [Helianthus debilis subsp. tardiflorus]